MGAACGRAWRSKIISSTSEAHRGNTSDGRSLQKNGGGTTVTGATESKTTSTTTTTTTGTITSGSSGPVQEQRSCDLFNWSVVEQIRDELGEEERVKKLNDIKVLAVIFPSNSSAPEIWLSELDVNWVLHLSQGHGHWRSFISGQLLYLACSWTLALLEITKTSSIYFSKEDRQPEFIRLIEATLSKMLPFVDAIVAVGTCLPDGRRWGAAEPADEKLQALILVRDALSTASVQIQDLLPAELLMAKLDKATWDTVEETMRMCMSSWRWATPRPSSDIHPVTRSCISYIKFLWANYRSVNRILHDAFLRGEFVVVPYEDENASHLTNLTIEMVHSLEEKLITSSCFFPDQSLKFLYLINNFHFILQQLLYINYPLGSFMPKLHGKIDDYVSSYTHVSWAPVLKCLHNPTPHCFTRHSPLTKFESKFHKTYTAQKLWKVPDPEMRKRMREAITEEVIPDFTEFFKDNIISTPRITPQEMEKMLQELFEG